MAVALRSEVDLWCVDLDEADALTVAERDRVAVGDVVDPIDGWGVRSGREGCKAEGYGADSGDEDERV